MGIAKDSVSLDAAAFPHIYDEVVDAVADAADAATLKALRLTSQGTRKRVDQRLKDHLLLRYDGVRSRLGGVKGDDWAESGECEEGLGDLRRVTQLEAVAMMSLTSADISDDLNPSYVDIDARMTIVGASTSMLVRDFEALQQTLSGYVSSGTRIVRGRMTELYPQSDEPARTVVLFFDTYPLALYHTVAHLQDPFAEEAVYHVRYDPAFGSVATARVQSVSTITAFPKRSTFLFTPVKSGRHGHSPNCQQCAGHAGVKVLDHILSHIVPDWIFNQGHRYRFVAADTWSRDWISDELVAPTGTVWASSPEQRDMPSAIRWMLRELARHASGMYDAGADGEVLMSKLENAVSFISLKQLEEELGPEDFKVVTAAPGAEFEIDAVAQARPNGHSRPVWPR